MANTLGTLLIDVKSDTTQLIQGFNRAESVINKTTKSMSNAIKAVAGAYLSLEAVDLARSYAKQVDTLTNANNRLKLVTKSTQEMSVAQTQLYNIAQNTNQKYSETIELYARVARSTKELGLSQKELLGITDSINKAMIISGGTAESQQSAMVQLGQAFSADFKAVGQELGSLREQAPRLYEAMVTGMGVTSDQFKKLAEDGKLSSSQIIKALESQGIALDKEYSQFTKTIEQSMVTAKNAISNFIFEFDKITGISIAVSETIRDFSKSIDSLSPDEIQNITDYITNATIAIGGSIAVLKLGKIAYEAYNNSIQEGIRVNKAFTDLEMAKAKATNLSQRATIARALAEEAVNSKTAAGIELNKTQYKQVMEQAIALDNAVKKQNSYVASLESMTKGFNLSAIGANLLKTALSTIPFIAISVGISAIATSLLSASKASETLSNTLQSSGDELKKLSNNQLNYRKQLLETELVQTRLDMANAKAKAVNGSLEDKANADEKIKLFEEQTKKLREIKSIQDEINKPSTTKTTETNAFNRTAIDEMVKKTLNPYQNGIDEINKKWQEQFDILVKNKQNTDSVVSAWTKELNDYEKDFNEKKAKEAQTNQKSLNEKLSQESTYYEAIKDYANLWQIEEQKLREDNKLLNKTQLDELIAVKKQAFDKEHQFQKDVMSADDWKNYYEIIGDYSNGWLIEQGNLYTKYSDLTKDEMAKLLEIAKKEYFEKFQEKQKELKPFDFDINLDSFDTPITNAIKAFDKLNESTQKYNEYIKQSGLTKEQIAQSDEKNISNQLKGYSNIAGAIGGLFESGSREMATFQTAQTALALIEGTRAILTAGTGDPYTAIPRMIAMGAMVKSLLGNIGVALGMNSSSTSGDSFSMAAANTGTGTSLGDSKKASESITNALKTLEDFAEPQYQVLESMNGYLEDIASNIGGLTSLLVRNVGYAIGEGFTASISSSQNISLNNTLAGLGGGAGVLAGLGAYGGFGAMGALSVAGPMGLALAGIDKLLLGGAITNVLGGIVNSVLGGLFGKTSVSSSLSDSGITFADALLVNAKESFEGSAYQTIATTVSKKSWFGSSSNTYLSTYFEGLNDEIENQFSLVLSSLYDTVLLSGQSLDIASNDLIKQLDSFVVSIGKVSLMGKSGTEIQELLTNVFAQVGDDLTKATIPALEGFQQVGEGLFETLTRVVAGVKESEFYIDRLGTSIVKYTDIVNQQGVVGFEALAQSIIKADEATYGLNNGVVEMIDNMSGTAEELYNVYLSFGNIRDVLTATSQSASNLSSSMILGAGSISLLESGTKSYMENFLSDSERLNIELGNLSDEFKLAGYTMPKTRQGFIDLINSIDTSTEEGAKAYGRIIALSDSYNETITEIEDSLSSLINTFSSLGDSVSQTIATLAGADTDSLSATSSIKSFWEKRKEIDNLLALNGNLTESQQSRLSTLVGEVNSLATNIQGLDTSSSSITSELIANLTSLESALNLEEQILSVNIVGINPNVSLADIAYSKDIPTLSSNTSNYVTSDNLSTDIKDILTTIKNNLSTYPQRTYDILDDVINGSQRVKVQTN